MDEGPEGLHEEEAVAVTQGPERVRGIAGGDYRRRKDGMAALGDWTRP